MNKDQIELQLSKNLRFLLREKGMTIAALSRKTGMPLQTLHGWLSGVEPKSPKQLKIVANYFGVSIDELIFTTLKIK